MFDIKFWQATGERALKTFIQVLLAGLGTAQVGIMDLAWEQSLSLALSAAVLSVLTSLGSANLGGSVGPSLVGETTLAPKPVAKKSTAKK